MLDTLGATESAASVYAPLTIPVRFIVRDPGESMSWNIHSFTELMEAFTYEANCWLTADNRDACKNLLDQLHSAVSSHAEDDFDYVRMTLHDTEYLMARLPQ